MSWQDIQEKTFTRWVNAYLQRRGMQIENLFEDLKNGLILVNLVEILTDPKTVGKYNKHPRIAIQKIENLGIVLKFLEAENLKLVNIGPEDIHDGNKRIILGLIWSLILRYQINMGMEDRDGDPNTSAKDELLEWVNSKIVPLGHEPVKNFKKDWNDGVALSALQEALLAGMCPNWKELPKDNGADNNQKGIDRGFDEWGVPKLLDGADMAHPKVDEKSVMTYIAYYRDLDPSKLTKQKQPGDDAARSMAYGPGLVEGIQEQPAEFTVETPPESDEKMEVKVIGPDGNELKGTDCVVTKAEAGKYGVVYQPKEPGIYKVHVTVGGHHVPGSIFTVEVLEDESIGGQGKVLVFYSTTSSTKKGKSDVVDLQRLLEAKKIHLRPDFEPWIPVDIMPKEDRDAIFRKAGTRQLPIMFIDDVYAGDYDTAQANEDSGKLDKLLRYDPKIEW